MSTMFNPMPNIPKPQFKITQTRSTQRNFTVPAIESDARAYRFTISGVAADGHELIIPVHLGL